MSQPSLPTDPETRKGIPLFRGLLKYFPDALCAVAECSAAGNKQHHADKPLHWDKSKSTDEADCLMRHLIDSGTLDSDGIRHTAKVAWRALALLQRELDAEKEACRKFDGNPPLEGRLPGASSVGQGPSLQTALAEAQDTIIDRLLQKEKAGLPLSAVEQRELIAAQQ